MKITLAQLNPTIGDFQGNLKKIEKTLLQVRKEKPDLVVFSELYPSGYPPQDLLEKNDFIHAFEEATRFMITLSKKYPRMAILCGIIEATGKKAGKGFFNSAILIQNGKILFKQNKSLLPTYDVFDECRYFDAAEEIDVFEFKEEKLGITICEDGWNAPHIFPNCVYPIDPVDILARKGATLLINISASPFVMGKDAVRHQLFQYHAKKHKIPILLINQVGGNDDLISDGRSMVINKNGDLMTLFPAFQEHVETVDLQHPSGIQIFKPLDPVASVYDALICGIQDYMKKCSFKEAVLGLSGGIDSAVTCCLAEAAIGSKNVLGISMPSPYSSKGSVDDARLLAENLDVSFEVVPITDLYNTYLDSLKKHFKGREEDETEENIQARIRGNILMAFSNKFGYLTLSSGNKSELSVGYCTLYGDMTGGLSVLADVPKTLVYQLAGYINRENEIISRAIIEKPPSAELKPDQKDQDSLPPYDILDQILFLYLDKGKSKEEIIAEKIDPDIVKQIIRKIDLNEHKRRQAAPGLKVTSKAFGTGRRMPIAARYDYSFNRLLK